MKYFVYCRKSSEAEDRQVMSLESQISTLRRTFGQTEAIEILDVYEEAFSAKAPGRPLFDRMLARIERGEAEGIVAWAPDRLARNSIDGGRVVYLLDRGAIRDLKFATYTFENNSQGKFMLQIMFGQSKYYSDALSDNVKRGNRTKIEKGWRPNQAPLGYRNDPATKTIVKDPVHFPLVRRMFDLMLSGVHGPRQIARIARDDWGFRTPRRRRIGGKPLALSSIYKILSNPFYCGTIIWTGQAYPGNHEPVVSKEEFRRVRTLLERPGRPRPQKHCFAYTGLIRCGACGLWITAEHKKNRYGHQYVYYHCTKPWPQSRCREPSIELRALESQIEQFLRTLTIAPTLESWVLKQVALGDHDRKETDLARRRSLEMALKDIDHQLNELTGLRLRGLLDDHQFVTRRLTLQEDRLAIAERLAEADNCVSSIEPFREFVSFSNRATEWFLSGNGPTKRLILETVGSNLTLTGKILNIEAKKPFMTAQTFVTCPRLLGVGDDIRTFDTKRDEVLKAMHQVRRELDTDKGRHIMDNIRKIRETMEPEILAKEDAARARKARGAGGARRGLRGVGPFLPPPHN